MTEKIFVNAELKLPSGFSCLSKMPCSAKLKPLRKQKMKSPAIYQQNLNCDPLEITVPGNYRHAHQMSSLQWVLLSLMFPSCICYQQASLNLHLCLFCFVFLTVIFLYSKQGQRSVLIVLKKMFYLSFPFHCSQLSAWCRSNAHLISSQRLWKFRELPFTFLPVLGLSILKREEYTTGRLPALADFASYFIFLQFLSHHLFFTPVFQPQDCLLPRATLFRIFASLCALPSLNSPTSAALQWAFAYVLYFPLANVLHLPSLLNRSWWLLSAWGTSLRSFIELFGTHLPRPWCLCLNRAGSVTKDWLEILHQRCVYTHQNLI